MNFMEKNKWRERDFMDKNGILWRIKYVGNGILGEKLNFMKKKRKNGILWSKKWGKWDFKVKKMQGIMGF